MSMADKDIEYWKSQLMYANRMWYEAGLIDDVESGTMREGNVTSIFRYISDYRGDQNRPMDQGVSPSDDFLANLPFALTNTMHSIISGRDPEVEITPKGRTLAEDDAWRRARINKVLIQSQHREARYKREMDRMLQCAFLTPFGVVRHGYTPGIEEFSDGNEVFSRFKNERPDYPWIRFYRPWDIRIDPLVNSFDPDSEARWVAFRDVYHEREVKKNKNLIYRKDWSATFTPEPYLSERKRRRHFDSPEQSDMYEVWTIYDASERKWFGLSPGSKKEVREETDWPIEWGQLPYSYLSFNEQLDTPFGIPFPKMYEHERDLYNKVWTIINTIVSRVRRVVFVNGEALDEDQRNNLFDMESLSEFIRCKGDVSQVAREIALGVLDPQLVGLLYQLKESMREVIGISTFDRGQRANVETASEANMIGAGSAIQKSRVQAKFEDVWANVTRVSHRALLQVQDERKFVIPIVGEENAQFVTAAEAKSGFISVNAADLMGEFDYGVKINSTLPSDMSLEYARASAYYQSVGGPQSDMIDQRAAHVDLANMAGVSADRWVVSREQIAAEAKMKAQAEAGGAEPDDGSGQAQVAQGGIAPAMALVQRG